METPTKYHTKIIKAGNLIQIYEYQKPITKNKITTRDDYSKSTEGQKQNQSLTRTRNNLIRLIESNKGVNPKFLTLTIANPEATQIDLDHYLKQFAKRYQRQYKKPLKAITIIEQSKQRQETYGQAPPHAHVYIDHDDFINPETLNKLWPYGFQKLNRIKDTKTIGRYVAKYLTKETLQLNKKGFRTTRNLLRPEAITLLNTMTWLQPSFQDSYNVITRDKNILTSDINHCQFKEYHTIDQIPKFVNFFTGEIATIEIVISEARYLKNGEYSPWLSMTDYLKIEYAAKLEAEFILNQQKNTILSLHSETG